MSYSHKHEVLPRNFSGGFVNWRVHLVHWAAKTAGLLVHVEGFPYGTNRNRLSDRDKYGQYGPPVAGSCGAPPEASRERAAGAYGR